jgi:hypothetical protein
VYVCVRACVRVRLGVLSIAPTPPYSPSLHLPVHVRGVRVRVRGGERVPAVCVCVREFESHADLNPRVCVFACALVCACVFQCARAWASEHIRARSRSAGAGACACACVHALRPALPPRSEGGAHSFTQEGTHVTPPAALWARMRVRVRAHTCAEA